MEFLILGPLEVRNGEHTVRLSAAKQRALLGVLLLHANETVSTSRLVDELWGERPPATAEKLVQGYVHALRKELGTEVLQTRPPGYRLSVEPRALDLLEFERLTAEARALPTSESVELRRQALALWRGPPLADVVLEGPERHNLGRLNELRLTTQIERIDAELELGRHAQLVGELEALVSEHPYQERAAAQLMLALYRSGRQAEALDVYRAVGRRLSDELGLQPGQELRQLEAAILQHDDALSVPTSTATPQAAPPVAAPVPVPRRRRLALGGAIAVLALAAVLAAALVLRDEAAPVVIPPNFVAAIDPATNMVTAMLQVGIRPGPVAGGEGSIWVGNLDGKSLTRIDPASGKIEIVATIPLPAEPTAIDVGRGAVWVVNGRGTLYRVDPQFVETSDPVEPGVRSIRHTGAGVDLGEGSVWAAFGESILAKVDPDTLAADAVSTAGAAPAGLVVAYGSVWVANSADATVRRYSPRTYDLGEDGLVNVGRGPTGIAAGDGSIWVACTEDDLVARLPADLGAGSYRPMEVGDGPTSVAFGAGAVWVANTRAGTVSRIDPETNEVATIEIGNAPAGITVFKGLVWVSVQAPVDEAPTS
jgi:YVTN family beta-propeller protein